MKTPYIDDAGALTKTEPLIISGSHADREARAWTLVTLFVKFLSDYVDLIVQVRQDFLLKPAAETIMGCKTFGEYCRNVLHYSESHIRRLIAGRNPATATHDGSKNRLPSPEPDQSSVQRLHRAGGFMDRCEDPVLRALVFEQARLLDRLFDTGDFKYLREAAMLEGRIVGHIWTSAERAA